MAARNPQHFTWPIAVAGIALFCVCLSLAWFLFREHAATADALRKQIESYREIAGLLECLTDLNSLLREGVDAVEPLHERAGQHVRRLRASAAEEFVEDQLEELGEGLEDYFEIWKSKPLRRAAGYGPALEKARKVLEEDVLPPSLALRDRFDLRIREVSLRHTWVLQEISWALAGLGTAGGCGGLLLGFTLSRNLHRSVRRIQVQVRDALGKFGPDFPTIVVTQEGDLDQLHTQIRGLVRQVEEAVARLQQKERDMLRAEQLAATGQLAAGVAHEIRNPLTSIKMLVQSALQEGDPTALTIEDLAIIEGEVRRMERSLNTFLDFARPPKPDRRRIDPHTVVRESCELIRGRAEKQRVRLSFVAATEELRTFADPEQLKQVLINLLLNALDAMPSGGTVELRCRREDAATLAIDVRDTGPGVAEAIREKLFQPFRSGKETGLGLGLFISRRIAEDHGGRLTVDDAPEGGACFSVCLPIHAVGTESSPPSRPAAEGVGESETDMQERLPVDSPESAAAARPGGP